MATRPHILSLADFLSAPSDPRRAARMPEEPARRPPPRLHRNQVQPAAQDAAEETTEFRHRGLLRRAQAIQAQPVELSQEVWTSEDDVWRVEPEPEQSSEEAPASALDETALRAAIEAEWQERLEEAVSQARAEGEAAGRAAAEAEWAPRLQALQEQLARELERLRQAWADHTRQLEPLLVELALEVAETLLDAPLPESIRGVSARTLTEAVEQLARSVPLEISMHPVDFLRLQEQGVIAQLESRHPDLHWDLNPGLSEGDWIVQTPTAMQRRIRQEMLERLRQRLGLTPHSDAPGSPEQTPPSDDA
ncbi:hypothetical protein [Rhodothermus marinus]|uniref:Flagellar assembly protein FliH n=1 Tax=Rhodothermus marinus (strain ATCC 43812 / DSM 4252 / R-10) TaxID=518766 RepID=D0MGD0_RHOM4|nr:hypothetical protein [Rhodothermus marinus]ACY47686.1 hypothetical protein Rmar_0788 [Rhodothermus marinus DSM 4252]